MKKILSAFLSIMILFSVSAVTYAEGVPVFSGAREVAGIIKVGVDAGYVPFEYMENDKLVGFDIDLMNYIGGRIGYGIEFVNMSFDKLIPAVVAGEIDCAISAITVTKERDSVIDYSRAYLKTQNITFENGQKSVCLGEEYALVFKEGLAEALYKSIAEPTDDELIYILVNNALSELADDKTIMNLIEKYELNKPLDESAVNVKYSAVMGDRTPAAKTNDEEPKISATPIQCSEWALKDVELAEAVGITDVGRHYVYNENITREEFCELIYNFCSIAGELVTDDGHIVFEDTNNTKVQILSEMGIISGKSATIFAPKDNLTREEAATIIIRMINKVAPMPATEMWFEYDDISEISQWASDAVQTVSNLGFMRGVGDNKFAPKATYTTEQAIVTLARVYEGAKAVGVIEDISATEIIGGSGGPTTIVIGENAEQEQEYEKFYNEVNSNTVLVDGFYIDEAIKLTEEAGIAASDEDLIRHYAPSEDVREKILSIGSVDYSKPAEIYYMCADREKIIENIKAFSEEELDGLEIEKLLKLNKVDFSVIGNIINASYGAENLAALSMLTENRGYIMPKDFSEAFAIYLRYDGEYSALVSFSRFGDGVIKASMSFVNNGERDNVFRRIYEITRGLGEGSIDMAIIK